MNFRHTIVAGALLTGLMANGPEQASAAPALYVGLTDLAPIIALAKYERHRYGRYVGPYSYPRPFLYTYPPRSHRRHYYYRYPRSYYYPPLWYFYRR